MEAAVLDAGVYHFHIPAREKEVALDQGAIDEEAFVYIERLIAIGLSLILFGHAESISYRTKGERCGIPNARLGQGTPSTFCLTEI